MSAVDLQAALINEIRAEYEHNLSQQIYISNEAWEKVTTSKEEIIRQIHIAYSTLPAGASSLDLSKAIFDYAMHEEVSPTQKSLLALKEEAQQLF